MNIYLPFLYALSATLFFGGCARGRDTAAAAVTPLSDSLPEAVGELTSALENNDSDRFSRLFLYPLERPYPLKDIRDAAEMRKYYSRLVDDSLKKAIVGPNSLEWRQYGWRGWSLDEGQYVWIDSLIYDIPYLSETETAELVKLRNAEMATLPPDMRQGWEPVITLKGADSGSIFRIDRRIRQSGSGAQTSIGQTPDYRLSVYNDIADLSGRPAEILPGTMSTEGTMQTRTYTFHSPEGMEIVYHKDPSDYDPQTICVIRDGKDESEQAVVPVYWLDLTSKAPSSGK